MKVLVGCEFSGIVREAFRRRGHDAWSCDLLPAEDGSKFRFMCDIFTVIGLGWDAAILHPPCTKIALCGNKHYGRNKPRYEERREAMRWTSTLWQEAKKRIPRVGLENPKNVMRALMGKRTQAIQPYMFGHMEKKETWLWLHNLPPLVPTNNVVFEMMKLPKNKRERIFHMAPSESRGQDRSRIYAGIAEAMAEQWGSLK